MLKTEFKDTQMNPGTQAAYQQFCVEKPAIFCVFSRITHNYPPPEKIQKKQGDHAMGLGNNG